MNADDKIDALITQERLPASYRNIVDKQWRPLADKIAQWRKVKTSPIVIGVNGAQGSGKSTLCAFLGEALLPERGLKSAVLSLDDFYLPKPQRMALAKNIHPLLRTRGVPGTHDVEAMKTVIDGLLSGETVSTPVFDKGADDRSPETRIIAAPVDVILFEGWCVGASAQEDEALTSPVNALERDEDRETTWRRYVNDRLKTEYKDLFSRLDRLIMLRVESMDSVYENRLRQERKLREARPGAADIMSDEDVARFIQHYERITRHCLKTLTERADIVIDVSSLNIGPRAK